MGMLESIKNEMAENKVTPEQERLLARISATLDKLDAGSYESGDLEALKADLSTLTRDAAGHYHKEIDDNDSPNPLLAEAWQISIKKLAEKETVTAARIAYETALVTGFGCRMGQAARQEFLNNASLWAEADFTQGTEAVYEISKHCPVSAYAGENKKLFDQAAALYADLHDSGNRDHISLPVAQNLSDLVYGILKHPQPGEPAEGEALHKAAGKLIVFANKLAKDYPGESANLIEKLADQLKDVQTDPALKLSIAESLTSRCDPQQSRAKLEDTAQRLATALKDVDAENAARLELGFLKDTVKNSQRLIDEDPVWFAQYIAENVFPYGDQDKALARNGNRAFNACVAEIEDEKLITLAHSFPAVQEKILHTLSKRSGERLESTDPETVETNFKSLTYVAGAAPTLSPLQKKALDNLFTLVDNIAQADDELARDKAIDLILYSRKIGQAQFETVEKFFEVTNALKKEEFVASVPYVDKFIRQIFDSKAAGDTSYKGLINALASENTPSALNALYEQVGPGAGGLTPLERRAIQKLGELIQQKDTVEERIDAWLDLYLDTEKQYDLGRVAAQNITAEISALVTSGAIEQALESRYNLIAELNDAGRYHSNLYHDSIKLFYKDLESCLPEKLDVIENYVVRITESDLYKNHFKSFKEINEIGRKLDKADEAARLAKQIGVDTRTVWDAGYGKGRLTWLYKKHAACDWLASKVNVQTGTRVKAKLAEQLKEAQSLREKFGAEGRPVVTAADLPPRMAVREFIEKYGQDSQTTARAEGTPQAEAPKQSGASVTPG